MSVILAILILAGSSGYTFVLNTCQECLTQEVKHSIEMTAHGECHLCGEKDRNNNEGDQEGSFLRHHCQLEVERLMTSEVVKTELQNDSYLYYPSYQIIVLVPDKYNLTRAALTPAAVIKGGRDLATFHCQFLS